MAPKSFSEESLKTDYGVNYQLIFGPKTYLYVQRCQKKRNE